MRKGQSLVLATLVVGSGAFSTIPTAKTASPSRASSLSAILSDNDESTIRNNNNNSNNNNIFTTITTRTLTSVAVSLAILTSPLHNAGPTASNIANADEWGKETEAPTLFTGETVMICKKRGPLGACLETTVRTVQNDNDKAIKYFVDPSAKVKERQERMLRTEEELSEGNVLITKLRKQSVDNKEKNDNTVRVKTLLNDQGASFGPFNSQVVILNTDGKTFTLLQNPQAMRLKKAGYIEDRKFVIQPSQVVIDEALESQGDLGGAIKGFFGGGGDAGKEEVVVVQEEVKSEAADAASTVAAEESAVSGGESVESVGEVTSD
mmetsp:Transcript_2099/g.4075  ORF Transcript_2099/g.4075 Transcript_2099/m.4075 type:complete len:322 (+) Transcript_2099:98-1063(+)